MISPRAVLVVSVVAVCVGFACRRDPKPPQTLEPRIVEPVSSGGGVYYFPVTDNDYRASLAAFRKAHPELRCQYFGADDRVGFVESYDRAYTRIVGHTIICGERGKYAQDETML